MAQLVASASRNRKKRTRPMSNNDVVEAYVRRLETALGDNLFEAILDEMRSDSAVRQVEAVAIGSRIVAPMAPSTTRAKAIERILARHSNMVTFKMKQRAVGGRSAA